MPECPYGIINFKKHPSPVGERNSSLIPEGPLNFGDHCPFAVPHGHSLNTPLWRTQLILAEMALAAFSSVLLLWPHEFTKLNHLQFYR